MTLDKLIENTLNSAEELQHNHPNLDKIRRVLKKDAFLLEQERQSLQIERERFQSTEPTKANHNS